MVDRQSHCKTTDRAGREMVLFTLDWTHADAGWTVKIWAYDLGDAMSRVESMRKNLAVVSECYNYGPEPDFIATQKTIN